MDGYPADDRYTVDRYLALISEGLLAPDDKVELLDGVVVAMPPRNPLHASGIMWVDRALRQALGSDVLISSQLPMIVGLGSVPEPDFAVLPGRVEDYLTRHPNRALLVVEVADSSLPQDRLTKSRIYAQAAIPEYWIVNLRDYTVEWFSDPEPDARVYRLRGKAFGETRFPLSAFPNVEILAEALIPYAPHNY